MIYRYRAIDVASGKELTGSLEASNEQEARTRLATRNLRIVRLRPTTELAVREAPENRAAPPRRKPGASRPTLGQRLERLLAPSQAHSWVIGTMASLGLILLFHGLLQADFESPRGPSQTRTVEVILEGPLSPAPFQPAGSTISVDFPEIPLHIERLGEGVVDSEGGLHLEVSFAHQRKPSYCELTLLRNGEVPMTRRIALSGDSPLRGSSTLMGP